MIPFLTFFHREVLRFWKVAIQTVITPLMSSFLYLVVFGISLGQNVNLDLGVTYLAFLIPGLMMMGLMNNAFQNSSSSIVVAKFTGELTDFKVVPLTNTMMIAALALGAVVRGGVVASITFVVGTLMHYQQHGSWLPIAHPFVLLFFIFIAGVVFGSLGLAAAAYAKNFDQLGAVSAFVLLPLTYFGGVFISLKNMSEFWQSVALWNPVLYFVNGLRYGILGITDVSLEQCVFISVISALVLGVIARYSLIKGSFQRW